MKAVRKIFRDEESDFTVWRVPRMFVVQWCDISETVEYIFDFIDRHPQMKEFMTAKAFDEMLHACGKAAVG